MADEVHSLDIELDRDVFMRDLIRELAGTLESVVGLRDAAGYISVVARLIGEKVDQQYRAALQVDRLSREQVSQVLVDFKRRIRGDFYIIEEYEDRIVLGNRACPYGAKVLGRSSMCQLTTNVFGHITAENLGYAKVELQQTIARGHDGCRVVVHLQPTEAAADSDGTEFFRREPRRSDP